MPVQYCSASSALCQRARMGNRDCQTLLTSAWGFLLHSHILLVRAARRLIIPSEGVDEHVSRSHPLAYDRASASSMHTGHATRRKAVYLRRESVETHSRLPALHPEEVSSPSVCVSEPDGDALRTCMRRGMATYELHTHFLQLP